MRVVDLQDRLGVSFDGGRSQTATCEFGSALTLIPEKRAPADRAGFSQTETFGRLPTRGLGCDRFEDALAQINRKN